MSRDFNELLEANWKRGKFLCVGLDPDIGKMPESARKGSTRETLVAFNKAIIDATKDIVCAYKPNAAFYEMYGEDGWVALEESIAYARGQAPDALVIYDAKRGDMGNTNLGYVTAAFDRLGADAITTHPYMGGESLKEFLNRADKGVFVMCRNSNPGAGEFQDLEIDGEPLYIRLAKAFAEKWNTNGNCGLVVGATYPDEIEEIREAVPNMPFLIPGTGAQGGDLARSVAYGKDSRGAGFIISTSRAIIYASKGPDYKDAIGVKAREFDSAIRASL